MPFDRTTIKPRLAELASAGVFVGTSSWKYPGWRGQLYDEARYIWHGRFAQSRFERNCLTEYAEVFKSVCVDAAYYKFPDANYLGGMVSQVPEDFLFTFKVTDEITLKRFTNLPRFGQRAGTENPNFLNAELFIRAFLGQCEPFRKNVGLLMFEFSKFYASDFARGRDLLERLDPFLGALPKEWNYGVEIRNRKFLEPEYFDLLARHGVAHVFNSWQDMPSVEEQLTHAGDALAPGLMGARFLLRPGRKYEEAVKQFSPYDQVKDLYPEGRAAGAKFIRRARARPVDQKAFLYVNNRFEGNALETIAAILEAADRERT